MQQRWEGWLGRAEQELPQAKAAAEAYQRGKEDAGRAGTPTEQMPRVSDAAHQGAGMRQGTLPQGYEQNPGDYPQDPGQHRM
jgi:hypothetical protein